MILLTPGPTPVPEDIRVTMSTPTIHHRTPEFEAIFASARASLLRLFGMNEVLMLASSGTGAMEAAVLSLTVTKALTINSGKFGERFGKIAKAFNLPYTELKYEWNTPVDVDQAIATLKADPSIDAIFIQVCESAGGLRHDVERLAREAKALNPNIMITADGITAVGVEKIDVSHIDCLITGSQKALMLPPGLAILGLSKRATQLIEARNVGYYFNLKAEIKNQNKNTTAYTAATTLIIGLEAMLTQMEAIGFDAIYAKTATRAKAMNEALQAIGLTIYPSTPAPAMATIAHDRADEIRKVLKKEFNVNIAGGQDHLSGKIFRINNMGLVEDYELSWALNAVEMALEKLGERTFDGTANRVYLQGVSK